MFQNVINKNKII